MQRERNVEPHRVRVPEGSLEPQEAWLATQVRVMGRNDALLVPPQTEGDRILQPLAAPADEVRGAPGELVNGEADGDRPFDGHLLLIQHEALVVEVAGDGLHPSVRFEHGLGGSERDLVCELGEQLEGSLHERGRGEALDQFL